MGAKPVQLVRQPSLSQIRIDRHRAQAQRGARDRLARARRASGLEGCLIGLHDNSQGRVIGHPSCVTPNSENIAVVVEEVLLPEDKTLPTNLQAPSMPSTAARELVRNRTKLGPELLGAAANCSLAFVSGIGADASLAGEGVTGGTSTVLLLASWTGFITGSIQCGNGVVRVGAILSDLDGTSLDFLDQDKQYVSAMLLVDVVGVGSSAATLPSQAAELWAAFTRLRAFNQTRLSFESLRRLNQLERLRAITKVYQDAARTGESVGELAAAAKRAQIAARSMKRSTGISVNYASTLQRIIGEETLRQLHSALRDVIVTVLPVGLSASPSTLVGSASGSVNYVINILDAGMPIL
jgi:hypothetical protein